MTRQATKTGAPSGALPRAPAAVVDRRPGRTGQSHGRARRVLGAAARPLWRVPASAVRAGRARLRSEVGHGVRPAAHLARGDRAPLREDGSAPAGRRGGRAQAVGHPLGLRRLPDRPGRSRQSNGLPRRRAAAR